MQTNPRPLVSVMIPCYNEEKTISLVLEALARQTYPLSQLEVLVVDGMSTDRTLAEINNFCANWPDLNVQVIENLRRTISVALNLAISQASGDYIIRMDAHAIPARDYVLRCVELLEAKVADNVGGRCIIVPGTNTPLAQAIAWAVSHPFGIGDALYRYARHAAYVDTVPFGAFRRNLFKWVGLYDEKLLANQDYDLNYRIRRAGGQVYLAPEITSTYYARSSLPALTRQYFRYGWWKVKMLQKYPISIRWRQLVPPTFVAGVVGLGCGGLVFPLSWTLWLGLVLSYLLSSSLVSALIIRQRSDWQAGLWLPLVFAIIHLSWGAGFWASLLDSLFVKRRVYLNG